MEEIAQVYSRSLFEVAKGHDKLDLIKEQLGEFTDALQQNRELAIFFFSPYFSSDEKKRGLERAVVDADPTLINFLELLIENHRMPVVFRARRQWAWSRRSHGWGRCCCWSGRADHLRCPRSEMHRWAMLRATPSRR